VNRVSANREDTPICRRGGLNVQFIRRQVGRARSPDIRTRYPGPARPPYGKYI